MSESNNNDNNASSKDLFGGLKDLTDRFLKNVSDAIPSAEGKVSSPSSASVDEDALARFKEKLRQRKPFSMSDVQDASASAKDAFEEGLNRLRRLRETPATIESQQPQPLQKSSLPARPVQDEVASPSVQSNEASAPADILARMKELLTQMTQKEVQVLATDWATMDVLSSQLRSAWVKVLSDKKQNNVADFLKTWSSIVHDVRSQSCEWGVHAGAWQAWAQKAQEDVGVLALWLKIDPADMLVDRSMPLEVPQEYKNTGAIPAPARNTPQELIDDLQELADYWEYAQHQSGIVWHNTPHESAVEEALTKLNEWSPTTKTQKAWKESALDAYTVLSGKMVLLQAQPAVVSHPSGPKL